MSGTVSTADRELIEAYLAEKLDDTTRASVEQRILSEPAFRSDVELSAALRDGLRRLDASGELDTLMSSRMPFWRRPHYAIAASVVAGLSLLTSLALYQQLRASRENATSVMRDAVDGRLRATARREMLTLLRVRGADSADRTWSASAGPTWLDFRIEPESDAVASYAIRVARVEGSVSIPVFEIGRTQVTQSGNLELSLHSAMLPPGLYDIQLSPVPDPLDTWKQSVSLTYRLLVVP